MSNEPNIEAVRRFGKQFPEVPPRPESAPEKPASEGAQTSPLARPHLRQYPESRRGDQLLPAFSRFSRSLDAELAVDEAVRRSTVSGHLNIDPSADPKVTRAQLAQAVQQKELTEDESRKLWDALHPGVDPGAVR